MVRMLPLAGLLMIPLAIAAAAWWPSRLGAQVKALAPGGGDPAVHASNAFGVDLWKQLPRTGNLAVSPASLSTALSMTLGGAKGETASQMARALHLQGEPGLAVAAAGRLAGSLEDPSRGVTLRVANRLFGEKSYRFEPAFLAATKSAFGAPLEPVDFRTAHEAARAHINGWVEQRTERRVKGLIPPDGVDAMTPLVLVNAIYFLGDWQAPFEPTATYHAPFMVDGVTRKDVLTMHQTETFGFAAGNGVKALLLPYEGDRLSMLLLLPDATNGLPAVERSLDAWAVDALARAAKSEFVMVSLPKFTIDPAGSLALPGPLKQLGMTLALDRERADFTGIANPPRPEERLYIGNVFHKAFVRVDEKGTEAAAATAILMAPSAAPVQKTLEFRADHPFLFFIRDNETGLVLFMGRVTNPSA